MSRLMNTHNEQNVKLTKQPLGIMYQFIPAVIFLTKKYVFDFQYNFTNDKLTENTSV